MFYNMGASVNKLRDTAGRLASLPAKQEHHVSESRETSPLSPRERVKVRAFGGNMTFHDNPVSPPPFSTAQALAFLPAVHTLYAMLATFVFFASLWPLQFFLEGMAACPTETRKSSPYQRFVCRILDQDLFEEVQATREEPEFGQRISEQMWKSEGLFTEAKQNHGLSRARNHGRPKMQIQAYLSAMAQNLKRLLFLFCLWLVTRHLYPRTTAAQYPNPHFQGRDFFNRPFRYLWRPVNGSCRDDRCCQVVCLSRRLPGS
jgi:hypothetical protein